MIGLGLGIGIQAQAPGGSDGTSSVLFDVIVAPDGSGSLTAAEMQSSTHGDDWGDWHEYHNGVADAPNTHTNVEDHNITLPFSIEVDGELYDGSEAATKGMTFVQTPAATQYDQYSLVLSESITSCVGLILARFDTVLDGGDPVTYANDILVFEGSNYTIPQYRHVFNGIQDFNCHSEGDNGAAVIYGGGWVIICVRHDTTANVGQFFVQDAITEEIIGASQSEHSPGAGTLVTIKLQDYLRGVTSTGTGSVKLKLAAFRRSDLTWPPYTITVPIPSSPLGTQTGDTQVTFTWSSTCQIFKIERQVNGGSWSTLSSSYNNNGVDSYVDNTVSNGNSYAYRVTAIIGAQVSAIATSSPVTVVTTTWTDAVAGAGTDTTEPFSEFGIRQPVVCGTTGSCTKIRVWIREFNFTANVKVALYDASSNLLGQGSANSVGSSSGAYVEVTLNSPVSVTASTTYNIAAISSSSGGLKWGYLSGQAANSSFQDFATSFASFPANPFPAGGGLTRKYAFGMGVI